MFIHNDLAEYDTTALALMAGTLVSLALSVFTMAGGLV